MIKRFFFLEVLKDYFLFLIYKTNVFIKLLKQMNIYLIYFSLLLFFIGVLVFISNRKHLLSILLRLEYIVLRLFLYLFFYLRYIDYELYFSIIFLTFRVCEGALGISILVSIIRTHGNDYFQRFNII